MTTTADDDDAWARKMLKDELEEQAEWRREKAVEYPDDRRNLTLPKNMSAWPGP
jgi:hypothetical protein